MCKIAGVRLQLTGTIGEDAMRETGAINRSLFTLGQTLAALRTRNSGCALPCTCVGVTGHFIHSVVRIRGVWATAIQLLLSFADMLPVS